MKKSESEQIPEKTGPSAEEENANTLKEAAKPVGDSSDQFDKKMKDSYDRDNKDWKEKMDKKKKAKGEHVKTELDDKKPEELSGADKI